MQHVIKLILNITPWNINQRISRSLLFPAKKHTNPCLKISDWNQFRVIIAPCFLRKYYYYNFSCCCCSELLRILHFLKHTTLALFIFDRLSICCQKKRGAYLHKKILKTKQEGGEFTYSVAAIDDRLFWYRYIRVSGKRSEMLPGSWSLASIKWGIHT